MVNKAFLMPIATLAVTRTFGSDNLSILIEPLYFKFAFQQINEFYFHSFYKTYND